MAKKEFKMFTVSELVCGLYDLRDDRKALLTDDEEYDAPFIKDIEVIDEAIRLILSTEAIDKMIESRSKKENKKYTNLSEKTVERLLELSKEGSHTFEELLDGYHWTFRFSNKYGVSIIKHNGSYGHEKDLWELAVTYCGHLCYDTPFADDVIPDLDEPTIIYICNRVAALTKDKEEVKNNEHTTES